MKPGRLQFNISLINDHLKTALLNHVTLIQHSHWHILPIKESRQMVTRNVVLTETQDQLVQALVASGRYQNVSEAMRAGLRLLEQEEAQLGGIRQGLFDGLAQAKTGELAEGSGEDAIRRAFRQARASS
jgi:antitoxin ParD1/3/4